MQIIRDINGFEFDRKSAVTVRTFDGVHSDHRKSLKS